MTKRRPTPEPRMTVHPPIVGKGRGTVLGARPVAAASTEDTITTEPPAPKPKE